MNSLDNIKKQAYYWNTASGLINAGQSAVILIFIAHFLTKIDAGIYTIAIALGNIVSIISKYGMRNYQVTDIEGKFTFNQYFTSRIITIISTLILTVTYLALQYYTAKYNTEKSLIILFICLWYMVESIEDVFYGMYQQKGRLDIGAKYFTLRLIISTIIMCVLISFRVSLITTSFLAFIFSIVFALIFISKTLNNFTIDKIRLDFRKANNLLFLCFPLALAATLSIYIGNSPKYLIDLQLDDNAQAVFGYLMMPAFTIMVINQFIYQPIIRDLGELWHKNDRKAFSKKVLRQYVVVAGITLAIVLIGATLGIPILSILYNTDLNNYRTDFVILLLGGGFFALSSFIMVPITAMRLQKLLAYGFVMVSIFSIIIGPVLVRNLGIKGATILYLALNALLSIYLTVCFFVGLKENKNN